MSFTPGPVVPGPAGGRSSLRAFLVVFFAVDALIAVVVVVAVIAARGGGSGSFVHSGKGPGSGGVVPFGEHLQWHSSGQNLAPASVDDDGVEDVVGVYRLLDMSSSTQTLYVGAFSGATFERLWKSGPYGTLEHGVLGTHVAVAGRRALVTDGHSVAHVLDVATGRELSAVKLTDQARGMCSPQGSRAEVFVQVADGANVLVNLETGQATRPLVPPPGCAAAASHECRALHAACVELDPMPMGGMLPTAAIQQGGIAVALGMKTPGTPVPMVMGYEPGTKTVRWSQAIVPEATMPSMGAPMDLLAGKLVTGAAEGALQPWHLVAFDAATGARQWSVVVPRSDEGSGPETVVLTQARVYVPHWTWLDVFDARDGKHLGTIGIW
jgi:hypothetical protein